MVPPAQWSVPVAGPYRPPVPSPYAQPAWAPRPPASSNGGPWVAILLVAIVVLVAVILGSAVVYLSGRDSTRAGGAPVTATVTTTSAAATTTEPATTSDATTTTSALSSAGATPSGTAALQGNPLFGDANRGLQRQPCSASGWPSDSAAGKRFFDSVAPCLDRAWSAAITAAGMTYREPTVVVPSGTVQTSPCGTTDLASENVAAFYCPANETLYMPPAGLQVSRYGNRPVIYLSVFAHEYGHHVQLVTGILRASTRLELQYGRSSARGLEMSRRTELEAQCFSGLFVTSVSDTGGQFTRSDYRTAYDDQQRGDRPGDPDRTHGTLAHSQGWWDTGYQTNRVARCNTWSASSTDVA